MNKININTSVQQECTCEELDAIAHDYFGIQQSLDDESYGCRATDNITLPDKIKATDGVYNDTKEAFVKAGVDEVSGTEYVRIFDDTAKDIAITNYGTSEAPSLTLAQAEKVSSQSVFNKAGIVDLRFLMYSKSMGSMLQTNGLLSCSNLKYYGYSENGFGCDSYANRSGFPSTIIEVHVTSLTSIFNKGHRPGYANTVPFYNNSCKIMMNNALVTEMTVPTTVIYGYALYNYKHITKLTIPSTVTSIGAYWSNNSSYAGGCAFQGCTNLKDVYMLGETPPTLTGSTNFNSSPTFHVPSGCTQTYTDAGYASYGTIVEDE